MGPSGTVQVSAERSCVQCDPIVTVPPAGWLAAPSAPCPAVTLPALPPSPTPFLPAAAAYETDGREEPPPDTLHSFRGTFAKERESGWAKIGLGGRVGEGWLDPYVRGALGQPATHSPMPLLPPAGWLVSTLQHHSLDYTQCITGAAMPTCWYHGFLSWWGYRQRAMGGVSRPDTRCVSRLTAVLIPHTSSPLPCLPPSPALASPLPPCPSQDPDVRLRRQPQPHPGDGGRGGGEHGGRVNRWPGCGWATSWIDVMC